MHDMNKNFSDSPFLLLLFILGIINYIIRKLLEEKVNNFLICQKKGKIALSKLSCDNEKTD